eukprot:Hpha_TRINITY_DN14088_c0_g1::TRINITY_DN14088_c0_g1_i1::g.43817::m.43817/K11992/ACOT8, PTE; acyl-CoA thioesterase 8
MSSITSVEEEKELQDKDRGDIGRALELERLDTNLYRSIRLWKPTPKSRAVFGGQIIGQSLVAAHRTVDPSLKVHSMHSYFVMPGDNSTPALYFVDRVRDGKSFATRSVQARQRDRTIFIALVSFHRDENSHLEFQDRMYEAPPPEDLPTRQEATRMFLNKKGEELPAGYRLYLEQRLEAPFPLDMRNCDPTVGSNVPMLPGQKKNPRTPRQRLWIKSERRLPDLTGVHACVAAYASDYSLISTAGLAANQVFTMAASLDHSMWFHAPFRADEWMLYDMHSSRARGARALIHGRLFTRDGTLAVSIAQEGLLRYGNPRAGPALKDKKEEEEKKAKL